MGYNDDIQTMPLPQLISMALRMWANYIETGDVCLSSGDAQRMNKPLKALSPHQHGAVARLHQVADEVVAPKQVAKLHPNWNRPRPACPRCGSTDILDASQSLDCKACGHSW